mgnify:CR=1 FL=1
MLKKPHLLTMVPIYLVLILLCVTISKAVSKTWTTMVEGAPLEHRNCIVLDAGHGGIDGGALSCTGIPESQLNLQITQRLNDLLNFLGYNTVMLRDTDTSLHNQGSTIAAQKISDLKQRVSLINQHSPTLLISIHQNTFSDKRYSGGQIFYCADEESQKLAQKLQNQYIQALNPGSKRKPKQAKGIYIMEHIQCSGILVECGFLTNEAEEARLRTDSYQKKISAVISTTVSTWYVQKDNASCC